ncbi:DUF4262 domain-containing protein [Intrasporangium zincisolvens]|uniref:DUF4262 domain-containing protein n=1 Tax=Intrasporangium zincisolvens TaxID=3080018 RepID=UPI0039B7533F
MSQWLDQEDRRVSEYIRRYGCSLEHVMPCDGEGISTSFCYTIGLFGLGHPELLVFGLDQASASGFSEPPVQHGRQGPRPRARRGAELSGP